MKEQVPSFDADDFAKIVKEHYGIEGEISPLVSFEDQNARVKTPTQKYVLKISNKKWPRSFVQMQSDVLGHLKQTAPNLTFPSVVKSLDGKIMVFVDGFAVRLLTYLEGDVLANMPRNSELYCDVGRFLGQFSKAMQSFSPEAHEGSDVEWKLDHVIECKKYLPEVVDEDTRDRISRLFEVYEKKILPKVSGLRKAIIHSDANEQNFLIDPSNPTKITGLIDFGEMQLGSQVNELAITLAYGLLGEDDIEMASNNIINGYMDEFPLEQQELDILYYLMAMRLVTTITMSSYSSKLFPENEYILVAQKPACALLKKLEQEKYILN